MRDRFVVPFVGAGVSMAALDRNGKRMFPSWGRPAPRGAARLREDGKRPEINVVEGPLKRAPDYFEGGPARARGHGAGLVPLPPPCWIRRAIASTEC